MTAILVIPEKNEGAAPLNVARAGLGSRAISGVCIVDGWSTDDTYEVLERERHALAREFGKPVDLIRSTLRETGKGAAMVTGMRWALEAGADAVMFEDADITSMSPRWCDALMEALEGRDHSRGTFDRAALDAQITRHVTRPLIAIYFPEGRAITQPLGGELVMSRRLAEALLALPIAPPHTWGIDTFFTVNTVAGGYRIADVYLVQKTHNPKDLGGLRGMFLECFDEMAKEIHFHGRTRAVPEGRDLVEVLRPAGIERVGEDVRTLQYTDLRAQLDRLFASVAATPDLDARLEDLGVDEALRAQVRALTRPDEFRAASRALDAAAWVPLLDQVTRGYIAQGFSGRFHGALFVLWQMRASAFALNEAPSWDAAEAATHRQADLAFAYGGRYRAAQARR